MAKKAAAKEIVAVPRLKSSTNTLRRSWFSPLHNSIMKTKEITRIVGFCAIFIVTGFFFAGCASTPSTWKTYSGPVLQDDAVLIVKGSNIKAPFVDGKPDWSRFRTPSLLYIRLLPGRHTIEFKPPYGWKLSIIDKVIYVEAGKTYRAKGWRTGPSSVSPGEHVNWWVNINEEPRNYDKADTTLLEKWASAGDIEAQTKIAALYFYGKRGFPKDKVVAYKWALVAAASGNMKPSIDAKTLLLKFELFMTPEEQEKGKNLADRIIKTPK